MKLFDFVNDRRLGIIKNNLDSHYWRPNFDTVISRLACLEDDVYFSHGNAGYVPPFACKFRKDKYRDILAVANEEGEVMLIDTEDNGLLKSFAAHNNVIFDICWMPDQNHLVTVAGDHSARLWNMNTCRVITHYKTHTQSIKCVDVCNQTQNEPNLFATASKDGSICIWDIREGVTCNKPSISIKFAHNKDCLNSSKNNKSPVHNSSFSGVSSIAFQDRNNLASAGIADSVIKIWDLRRTYIFKPNRSQIPAPRYMMKYGDDNDRGMTSLVFDSVRKNLYGSSTANKIYAFDCHSYNDAVVSYEGFKCRSFFIKMALSADGQYLLCGSSDNKAYVWKTAEPGPPILELPGHKCEVTAVAWGPYDVTKAVTCGDDNKILVWKTINDQDPDVAHEIISKSKVIQREDTKCNSIQQSARGCQSSITTTSKRSLPKDSYSPPFSKRNNSHNHTPDIKSITSFFQPISSTSSASNVVSPPVQVLSPSKTLNQNISPVQGPSQKCKSPVKKNLFSKENYFQFPSKGHKRTDSDPSKCSKNTKKLKRTSPTTSRRCSETTIKKYFQQMLTIE